MAEPAKKGPTRKAPAAEPVNSEQLAEQEATPEVAAIAPAPTTGELEERAVMAEERAEAAELRNATMEQELELLKQQMNLLLKAQRALKAASATQTAKQELAPGEVPVFDEDAPYGLVVGDEAAAYVQNGHQFGKDKQYIATEAHRGTPRAFNPRLVGLTKPRPGQVVGDALADFRDRA